MQVSPNAVAEAQRQLQVDVPYAVQSRRAAQRLGRDVELQCGAGDLDNGQAASVDGYAIADGNVADFVHAGVHGEPQPIRIGRSPT